MTTLVRPRFLAGCAVFIMATAGFLAPPASAAAPSVTISPPGDQQLLPASAFAVEAEASMGDGVVVGKILLTLKSLDTGSKQAPQSGEIEANGRNRQQVSFPVQVDYNGKYQATVTATGRDNTLLLPDDKLESRTVTRDFFVDAPPAPPADVRPAIDPETRVVTVTWKPNAEKDLVGYFVQRNGAAPIATAETSFTDASTANAGGTYTYKVQAVRRGATADQGRTSDPVTATANVPDPPGPPTTVAGGTTATTTPGAGGTTATTAPGAAGGGTGTGSTPGGTTGTTLAASSPGALTKSGTIDLSGFSSIQSQARRPAPRVVERDPGFTSTLPFDTTNTTRLVDGEQAGAAEPGRAAGGDDPEVRELGAEDASNNRQQSAAFLAAGLLATVLLMHLLWIKGEVQREPLEALVPE
jgi:hypothetical protein